jgi:hypothetical protein
MRDEARFRTAGRIGALAVAAALSGCVVHAEPAPGYYEPAPVYHSAKIPPGHLPPPGACRIWYPDRPPGHQPPPGDCYSLQHRVPPGAILVRG